MHGCVEDCGRTGCLLTQRYMVEHHTVHRVAFVPSIPPVAAAAAHWASCAAACRSRASSWLECGTNGRNWPSTSWVSLDTSIRCSHTTSVSYWKPSATPRGSAAPRTVKVHGLASENPQYGKSWAGLAGVRLR